MKYAYYKSKIGNLQMSYEDEKLLSLKIVREQTQENQPSAFSDRIFGQICEYLEGQRKVFDVDYELRGTEFQKRVWQMLEDISYGKTLTYGEIATLIGGPKSARGVGSACGKNPIWLIVPCHRVVGKNGSLTGYAGGVDIKEKLLKIESDNISTNVQ